MDRKELETATTLELLEYIQGKAYYPEAAECAFHNFFLLFENELTKKCRQVAANWGFDQSTGDIISEQALAKFWEKPELFKVEKCTVKDLDKCILFYLFTIAKNTLADRQREMKSGRDVYSGDEEIVVEYPELENLGLPVEKLKEIKIKYDHIKNALARLSPKHKIIFLTYHAHEHSGVNLPRNLLRKLRDELDLNQNSIRVYKKVALETVHQYLEIYGNK